MEIYQNLSLENLPNEEWRDVVGYENLYQVSNMGRVKSYPRIILSKKGYFSKDWERILKSRIIKQRIDKGGYCIVTLYKNSGKSEGKIYKVHRLVATAFIENKRQLPQIDHLDCNRVNNNVNNLKWCTCKENHSNPNTQIKRSDKVLQINDKNEIVCEFSSPKDASRKLRLSYVQILSCCRGIKESYKGFKWVYLSKHKLNTN